MYTAILVLSMEKDVKVTTWIFTTDKDQMKSPSGPLSILGKGQQGKSMRQEDTLPTLAV